jgi:putative transposase
MRVKKSPNRCDYRLASVKTTDHSGERGYDAGKRLVGRKRHLLVDTLGLILLVSVHPANVQDRDGAKLLLQRLAHQYGWIKLIWADGGYVGKLIQWVEQIKRHRKVRLEIVKRSDKVTGFKVLPRRWVVERTFGWLSKYRRLSKDYETNFASSEAMIYIAMTRLMLKRIS